MEVKANETVKIHVSFKVQTCGDRSGDKRKDDEKKAKKLRIWGLSNPKDRMW